MKSTILTTLLASASLYHTTSASCAHGTFLHRRAEGEIAAPSFGYTGAIGPLNWANLKAENSACNTGSRQSPINLKAATIAHDAGSAYKLTIADLPNGAEFENLGTTVEVVVNGTLETPLKNYAMRQFHFHTPSEHRVEEEFFSIESHFVFESEDKSIAVVSFLINLGETQDPLFGAVLPSVTKIPKLGEVTTTPALSFGALIAHVNNNSVLRYVGSLTTPPCTEGVDWIIASVPLTVNRVTFDEVKKVVKFNSRFTQADLGTENLIQLGAKANIIAPEALTAAVAAEEGVTAAEAGPAAGTKTAAAAERK